MEFDISEEAERKKRLVLEDDLRFPNGSTTPLLIAGLDVSFVPGSNDAVGCLVVLSFPDLASLYKDCQKGSVHHNPTSFCLLYSFSGKWNWTVCITEPYVPGYLAYRELPIMKSLIEKLKLMRPDLLPHLLFVDGNGTLHPRHFGSACHVGILTGMIAPR
ncbi:endonuclease V-domain-containing protein [Phlyctochytrium arcticum]|nr:endonuclease V-domain-containing protein [Phlyctochytrium arcticum]